MPLTRCSEWQDFKFFQVEMAHDADSEVPHHTAVTAPSPPRAHRDLEQAFARGA